jgi:hypothetical protein
MTDAQARLNGWQPIETAPKNGTLLLLLVDYSEGDHWIDDEQSGLGRTIGHNNDDNVGEGEGEGWQFAGWCWTHDHYVEGSGKPIKWMMFDRTPDAQPSSTDEVERVDARVGMFIEILFAMGGTSDASESHSHWINAFCEECEGCEPDTFNRAIELGYTCCTHDSDTDASTVYLTELGREVAAIAAMVTKP